MDSLAGSYYQLGRYADALKLREETFRLWKDKLGPDHRNTVLAIGALGASYQAVGNYEQAVKMSRQAAEAWEKRNRTDAVSLYNAARLRAILADALQASDKSSKTSKQADAEANSAMAWLTKAAAAGYTNVSQLKKDSAIKVLRNRDDFKKLLAELEAKENARKK
jgi:tetratricopeptide (TPR) repeat protein